MKKYSNGYFERYAKICLRELVDKKFGDYILADAGTETKFMFPDLMPKNDLESIGIEITRAETAKDGQERAWIAQCFGEKLSSKEINEIGKGKYHSLNSEVKTMYGQTILDKNLEKHMFYVDLIKATVSIKLSKLNSSKSSTKVFKSNRLFIFCPDEPLDNGDFIEILKFQNNCDFDIKFDFIYLFDNWQLCTLDFNMAGKFDSQHISDELLEKIKIEANPRKE